MTSGHFDETDLNCYYYENLTLEDARAILMDQDAGVFLVRHSSRPGGGYVVCVKEDSEVMQYPVKEGSGSGQVSLFIREECPFKDLPSLLSFYKRNLFKSTALIRPVSKERVMLHQLRHGDSAMGARGSLMADMARTDYSVSCNVNRTRISAPPGMAGPRPSSGRGAEDGPPVYAKVIKARFPSAYEASGLTLKVGDKLRITKRKDGQGQGEHLDTGKIGNFPLTHIELIDYSPDIMEKLQNS